MRCTLKDIARECGLSMTLVSQVLRNPSDPRYKPETKSLVQEIAERMHYVPNRAAASLQRGYSKIIALVTPWNMVELTDSLDASLSSMGYQLISLSSASPDVGYQERALKLVVSLDVDGVIWLPFGNQEQRRSCLSLLESCNKPVLIFERDLGALPGNWSWMHEDYGKIADLALGLFRDAQRPLYILSNDSEEEGNQLLFGALSERANRMGKPSLTFHQPAQGRCDWRETTATWATEADIFCDGDWLAWDLFKQSSLDLRLPEKAVLCYGDYCLGMRAHLMELLSPKVTAIRRPFAAMGEQAAHIIIEMIQEKPEAYGEHVIGDLEVFQRETTVIGN